MFNFNRFKMPIRQLAPFIALGMVSTTILCDPQHPAEVDSIAMFLKPDSKALVEKFLKTKGIADPHVNHVVVHGKASKELSHVFEPLYGERTAFRLKGLITSSDGRVVGVGRMSNMVGELKDDEVEVSLPISNGPLPTNASDLQSLHEMEVLPTRLVRFPPAYDRNYWKGRLPAATIDGHHYPAINISWVRFPTDKQVVLDGHLCSRNHFDSHNHICTFDRATEVIETIMKKSEDTSSTTTASTTNKEVATPSSTDDPSNPEINKSTAVMTVEDEEDANETCPVCRYLKKGPCKAEFLNWDKCMKSLQPEQEVTACYEPTSLMMRCMRKHEYYDIMTAGTDFTRLDEAEMLAKQQESSTISVVSEDSTEKK